MCLLHCQSTPKRNCMEIFSCPHAGEMLGGDACMCSCMQQHLPLIYENWWGGAFRKRWCSVCYIRWMFSVPSTSPPTPRIPSMMNNSGCAQSGTMKCIRMWVGVARGRECWKVGDSRLRVGECVLFFIPFLIFKAHIPGSCTIAGSWNCFFFVGIIKSDAGRHSDWWEKSFKETEDILIMLVSSRRQANMAISALSSSWFT